MLSRTAENLFWIARYMERAENIARLLDMGYRMGKLAGGDDPSANEWASVILSSGAANGFSRPLEDADQDSVSAWLVLNRENTSSVMSSMEHARENARSVRTALTSEVWEAINESWLELRVFDEHAVKGSALPALIEWTKQRGAQFRGAVDSSLLRDEGFDFLRLGVHVERADNTARLLDVKYHVLLKDEYEVGGSVDYYQWVSILRAANSLLAYQVRYKDGVKPWNISDFLILDRESPRSLLYCYENISQHLENLARANGRRSDCQVSARAMNTQLSESQIGEIFQLGLHEFLSDFITHNNALADEIGIAYGFGMGVTPSLEQTLEE